MQKRRPDAHQPRPRGSTTPRCFVLHSAFIILHFCLSFCRADAPRDLSATLAPLAEKHHLPGMVGAILRGDRIFAIGSCGVRKAGDPAPFLSSDLIHLGSDTKAMTAILIAQLIDKNQLSFDSTMAELFPDLAGKMNPAMARITVRSLLTHTAGFPHDLDWGSLSATKLSLPRQRRLAVARALAAPPVTPIGKFSYSNVGYVLLGAIVEEKTGSPWEEVIRQDLFRPLHMETAGFGPPGERGKVDQPWGHILRDNQLTPVQFDNAPVLGPAGRVHCSITDWSKFIAEVMHCAQGRGKLVSNKTFQELIRPISGQDYAGGWLVTDRPWAGGSALTHSGSNTTWFCTVWIAPKKDFAVMVATNDGVDGVDKAVDEAIGALIQFNQRARP